MGLDIEVGKEHTYGWSYGSLHEYRLWVAKNVCKDTIKVERMVSTFIPGSPRIMEESMWSEISEKRFPHLFLHSDCSGDYLPIEDEPPGLERGSSVKLRSELLDIDRVLKETTFEDLAEYDVVRGVHEDLLRSAERSVENGELMRFR